MNLRRVCLFSLPLLLVFGLASGCSLGTSSPASGSATVSSPEERTARLPQEVSTAAAAGQASTGAPASGGTPQVTILLTNDVHGKVDPCG
jgi:hypothetical protein